MAELFHKEILIVFALVFNCIVTPTALSAASDFKVKLASVGSNIKLRCTTDNTSLLTTLRYSSDSGTSEMTRIAFYNDGAFRVTSDNYDGRILVQNLSTVILNNVTVEDSGFYKCRVDFKNGLEDDNIIQLKIGVAPKIQPLSVTEVLEKMFLKVKCIVHGLPEPIVTWSRSDRGLGRDKEISTSNLLEINNIEISQSGVYHCRGENYMGQDVLSVEIKVYKKPHVREFFLVGSLDGVVWQCQDILLQCEVISDKSLPVLNYILYHGSKMVMNQSKSGMFIISNIGLQHNGVYSCVPETRLGQGWNETLKLYVKASVNLCKEISTSSSGSLSQITSTVKPAPFNETDEYIYNGSTAENGLNVSFVFILLFLVSIIG